MDQQLLLQIMAVFTGVAAVSLVVMMVAMIITARQSYRMRQRAHGFLEQLGPLVEKATAAVDSSGKHSAEVLENVKDLTESSKRQMQNVDALLTEVGQNARIQMERIDQALQLNLQRVNDTTSAVQSTVLVPVKQIRGVAAAVNAVLGSLTSKSRPTVDRATIDEEMFI